MVRLKTTYGALHSWHLNFEMLQLDFDCIQAPSVSGIIILAINAFKSYFFHLI